jgi:hypothetical protein
VLQVRLLPAVSRDKNPRSTAKPVIVLPRIGDGNANVAPESLPKISALISRKVHSTKLNALQDEDHAEDGGSPVAMISFIKGMKQVFGEGIGET